MHARLGIALALVLGASSSLVPAAASADTYFVTVAGLGGEPDYEQQFRTLAHELDRALKGPGHHLYTLSGKRATRIELTRTLREVARLASANDDFVLTLIGHGSFDGFEYKMNLVGPDIAAGELAVLCSRIRAKRQLIVDTTSASGGAVAALQRRGRAVIAATKSGTERNATVFARYWADALEDPTADLDKNDAISALEAFQYAAAKTAAFYSTQKRLATEHAVFEDTGRAMPVREASSEAGEGRFLANFTLVRRGAAAASGRTPGAKQAGAPADAAKRALLARKEQLEQRIDVLKYQRAALSPQEYKREITRALVELAKTQEALDK
ncbi:MAG: hypothetical protein ACREUT_14430 [Steroidobacteraceae bacterium]